MFDAFLAIYRNRTRDLLRIATGGTGVLPLGDLHPDLVERLAQEAAKTARHLLLMCIRAIDYCPPVDVTYGDYMRAMITADFDLVPEDDRNYRVAIIEAFRAWGIYPRGRPHLVGGEPAMGGAAFRQGSAGVRRDAAARFRFRQSVGTVERDRQRPPATVCR